jgi:sulfite exporter TauE/SafE
MEISVTVTFLIGLFSAMHCLGMCGSIASALTLGLPATVRERPARLGGYVVAFNLGRIASYSLAGALAGLVGSVITNLEFLRIGHEVARVLAALLIIVVGLYLTGWVPQLRRIDRFGQPVWRRLEPVGRRLMPIRSPWQALLFGLVWGWLPCGLVYYVLTLTLAAGGALEGGLYMFAYGLGTLPASVGVGMVAGWFTRLARNHTLRQGVGLAIVLFGVISLTFGNGIA